MAPRTVPAAHPVDPWDRRPGEGLRAHEAFTVYRDLGPARSHPSVAEEVRKSVGLIARWSARHDWVDRVAAWDEHQARESAKAQAAAIVEMAKRHADTALMLQGKALEALRDLDPRRMSVPEIRNYLTDAIKLERQARGEPERIDVTSGGETISVRRAPEQPEDVLAVLMMAEVQHRAHQMTDDDYAEIERMANEQGVFLPEALGGPPVESAPPA